MSRKRTEQGMTLIILLVLMIVVVGAATVFFKRSVNEVKYQRNNTAATQAVWNANALVEEAKYQIETSGYDSTGNLWLSNAISTNPAIANEKGTVLVGALTSPWYELRATSTTSNITKTLVVRVRDRDVFSKYLFFTSNDDINIGTTTTKGQIHTNQSLNFYYGGAQIMELATAVTGFGFGSGADWSNTDFYGGYNPAGATVGWPQVSQLSALETTAIGPYKVSSSSSDYSGMGTFNTEIEFLGDQVRIVARSLGGSILSDATHPMPANGLIYVEGDVTSMKGDLNGQVSVATLGKVDITGPIKYVDADNDPKYHNDTGGWTIDEYVDNPAYNGTSVLGVMSQYDITVTPQAPYNMEMMGAYMSLEGNWHCDLSQTKGHLRYTGSMVSKERGWRYSGSTGKGWSASGLYTYDVDMYNTPPPHFLQVETTDYRAWEVE